MNSFLKSVVTWVLIIAISTSHVLSPAFATPSGGGRGAALPVTEGSFPHGTSFAAPSSAGDDDLEQGSSLFYSAAELLSLQRSYEDALEEQGLALPPVRQWVEARAENERSFCRRWVLRASAGVGAAGAGFAVGELFIFSDSIGDLLVSGNGSIPPVPAQLWAAGVSAGMLILLDAYTGLEQGFNWVAQRYTRADEEKLAGDHASASSRRSPWYVFGLMGTVVGLMGKNLFAFWQANAPPIPPNLIDVAVLAAIASLPYFGYQCVHAVRAANQHWDNRPRRQSVEEKNLHLHLTATYRKIAHNLEAASDLVAQLDEIEAAREKAEATINEKIKTASEKEKNILKERVAAVRRLSDMLKLRILYDFGQQAGDEKYQTPAELRKSPATRWGKFKRWFWGEGHPWGDRVAKTVGSTLALPAYGAAGFSFWFILTSFGLSSPVSIALSVPAGGILGSSLVIAMGNKLRTLWRLLQGELPIDHEKQVPVDHHLGHPWLRAGLEGADWLRQTYLMLAAALVAGEGFYNANLSNAMALPMLIPYILAFGANSPKTKVQDIVTAADRCFHPDKRVRDQQRLSPELRRLTQWIKGMTSGQAQELHSALMAVKGLIDKTKADVEDTEVAAEVALLAPLWEDFYKAVEGATDAQTQAFKALREGLNALAAAHPDTIAPERFEAWINDMTDVRQVLGQARTEAIERGAAVRGNNPLLDPETGDIFYDALEELWEPVSLEGSPPEGVPPDPSSVRASVFLAHAEESEEEMATGRDIPLRPLNQGSPSSPVSGTDSTASRGDAFSESPGSDRRVSGGEGASPSSDSSAGRSAAETHSGFVATDVAVAEGVSTLPPEDEPREPVSLDPVHSLRLWAALLNHGGDERAGRSSQRGLPSDLSDFLPPPSAEERVSLEQLVVALRGQDADSLEAFYEAYQAFTGAVTHQLEEKGGPITLSLQTKPKRTLRRRRGGISNSLPPASSSPLPAKRSRTDGRSFNTLTTPLLQE